MLASSAVCSLQQGRGPAESSQCQKVQISQVRFGNQLLDFQSNEHVLVLMSAYMKPCYTESSPPVEHISFGSCTSHLSCHHLRVANSLAQGEL